MSELFVRQFYRIDLDSCFFLVTIRHEIRFRLDKTEILVSDRNPAISVTI